MQEKHSARINEWRELKTTTGGRSSTGERHYMDLDIQEALRAVRKAVETRKARDSRADTEPEALRDLDETVCLTSRSLYMRFLSTALWCRSVDETTLKAVREALQGAVACLPLHD